MRCEYIVYCIYVRHRKSLPHRLFCCCCSNTASVVPWLCRCQDTSDPRHFGPKTLRHHGDGAEVSIGHFGTGAEVSACN